MHTLTHNRLWFFFAGFYLFTGDPLLYGQSMEVKIDQVTITAPRKSAYSSGLHTIRIDSLLKTRYFGSDLSRILSRETNLNITSYGGEGSLSSIRLRGSAPSQTQINWNGIPVNCATTGSTDLSLLAGGLADAIEVAYGASGSLFGSGTFGGSINLLNTPDWSNRLSINTLAETGSWNHFKGGLNIRAGAGNWQYHLSGIGQSSPNTYTYPNEFKAGNPVETRLNDSLLLMTGQQHLFIRLPGNWFVQYGGWWHSREKMLPSSMSSRPLVTAAQSDQSLRQFVRVSKWWRKTSLEITGAALRDSLTYTEKTPGTDSIRKQSGIRSDSYFVGISHRWFINSLLTVEGGAESEYLTARVDSYSGAATELHGAAWALLKYTANKLETTVSYRQAFYSMTGPRPLFSAAFRYHLADNGLSVKGQISNKFRYPSLNDRFWTPGGNPGLLPENGLGYDLGAGWDLVKNSQTTLSLNSQLFMQDINNWIQWVPSGTWWSPQNIRRVRCQGIETDLSGELLYRSIRFSAKIMYSYTESLDMGLEDADRRADRQLAYVPFHLLNGQAAIEWHGFEARAGYRFTGRRYTTDNHDPWLALESFHLADLSAGYSFRIRKDKMVINVVLSNLFDTHYQLIRAYPAPGRAFRLSLNYLFQSKSAEK